MGGVVLGGGGGWARQRGEARFIRENTEGARAGFLGTLSLSPDDPPTRPQVQAMLDLLNTLLTQLTRV